MLHRTVVLFVGMLVSLFALAGCSSGQLAGMPSFARPAVDVTTAWGNQPGEKLVVPEDSLMYLINQRPINARVDEASNTITFTTDRDTLLVGAGLRTAPSMMTFSVMGLVNPTIRLPVGAMVKVLFVNGDNDMPHSFVVTRAAPPYPAQLSLQQAPVAFAGAATPDPVRGTEPEHPDGIYHGNSIEFVVPKTPGTYWYACYFPGHAERGMYGRFVVLPAASNH